VLEKGVDVGQFVTRGAVAGTIYAVDFAEVRLPIPDDQLAFADLPLGYRGEVALGASWAHPIQNFQSGLPTWNGARDQYGLETYWKLLLMPDLWVTPGVQMLFDPSYNPDTDFVGIAQIKFRLFL